MHVDDVIIFFLSERKLEDGGLGLRLFLLCYIGSLGYFCALVEFLELFLVSLVEFFSKMTQKIAGFILFVELHYIYILHRNN